MVEMDFFIPGPALLESLPLPPVPRDELSLKARRRGLHHSTDQSTLSRPQRGYLIFLKKSKFCKDS